MSSDSELKQEQMEVDEMGMDGVSLRTYFAESSEAVECLVDSLSIVGSGLGDANLGLTTTDLENQLEHLAGLSHSLNMSMDSDPQGECLN